MTSAGQPTVASPPTIAETPTDLPALTLPPIQRRSAKAIATPTPRPSLLQAVGDSVGEPFADPTPYASSSWLRMVETYRPPWAAGDTLPEGGGTWSSEVSVAPPSPARERVQPARAGRRATLAESRRLGLGTTARASAEAAADEVAADASPRDPEQPPQIPPPDVLPLQVAPPQAASAQVPPPQAAPAQVAPPQAAPVQAAQPQAPPAQAAPLHLQPSHVPPPEAPPLEPQPPQNPVAPDAAAPVRLIYRSTLGDRSPSSRITSARKPLPKALIHPRTPPRPDHPRTDPAPNTAPPPPPPSPQPEVAPPAIADAVRRDQGVDVSDVPIHRGPEASAKVAAHSARALTADGEVHLPADVGPLDHPVARGLLAHELTHAAQQRVLGTRLPPEDSPAGAALEAEAVDAERRARGLSASPAPADGPGSGPGRGPGLSLSHTPTHTPAQAASWTAPWQVASTPAVQRQVTDVTTLAQPPASQGSPSPGASSSNPATQPSASQSPTPPPTLDPDLTAVRDKLLDLSRRRPLDLDDPAAVEELASQVYRSVQARLRRELLLDRERAGRLGEVGPLGWAR